MNPTHTPIADDPGVQGLAQLGRNAIERVSELERELAAAVAERDELRDAMADKIAHDAYITGLTAGHGGLIMGLEGDGPRLLAAAFVSMYRDCGASNYLEMTLQDPANGERFAVTVQRAEGKTPDRLRREAEAELDTLRARLAAIDNAPTVAIVTSTPRGSVVRFADNWAPFIGSELIARPAKESM